LRLKDISCENDCMPVKNNKKKMIVLIWLVDNVNNLYLIVI